MIELLYFYYVKGWILIDKKGEILEAAYLHFCKRGYNVSMAEIAKSAGIKPPSIYSHFSSKDEIIALIAKREISKYQLFLDQVYEDHREGTFKERLKSIFFDIIRHFKDNDKLRFWRNLLLIDNDDLRKACSEWIFDLEMDHIEKVKIVFGKNLPSGKTNDEETEGSALLFLAMIQGALEGELLCYRTIKNADDFILKTWQAYESSILQNI